MYPLNLVKKKVNNPGKITQCLHCNVAFNKMRIYIGQPGVYVQVSSLQSVLIIKYRNC